MSVTREEALNYHSEIRPGKIEVIPTKPCTTSRELSLAYTPGVAEPCKDIEKNEDDAYKYTAKGNLVAVVSNGTAVLGLGNIGAIAGKPVMEGKGVLFKRFADIDVYDIELKTEDPAEVIKAVQLLEPTFGGINLEDIKAPECFTIEEELKKTMNIPVFHDDQHGTAIISCAALINAAEIAGKKLEDIKMVVVGAGAAGIACCNLYVSAGMKKENIYMFDSKGHIHNGRNDLNEYKQLYSSDFAFNSLEDAMKGADAFVGLSKANLLSPEMVASMAENPIVFAMANPDPEIRYDVAIKVRKDIIMATGRSDFPNQVNNVLGFPFIFRGALDVRAKAINEEMKMAAVIALATLAKDKVPEVVVNAYGGIEFSFGRDYIIPKPFDPRVLWKVAPAVAKAAIDTGVARMNIDDWHAYEDQLKERLGFSQEIVRLMIHKAQRDPKRIAFIEGEEEKIIRAAHVVFREKIGFPVLIGRKTQIEEKIKELGYSGDEFEISDPSDNRKFDNYVNEFYKIRRRKGITHEDAVRMMRDPDYFGPMMVRFGDAHTMIGGLKKSYPRTIRPALQCLGIKKEYKVVAGLYLIIVNKKVYFFADCSVNVMPNEDELASIAISSADTVRTFDIEPKVAMISFSNFGSAPYPDSIKVKKAVELVKAQRPDIIIDGEMQADTAVVPEILAEEFPFSDIQGGANILVFPNLTAANAAYKLFERLTNATVVGPLLMGMNKPVHVLQRSATVDDIINMSAIAVADASGS